MQISGDGKPSPLFLRPCLAQLFNKNFVLFIFLRLHPQPPQSGGGEKADTVPYTNTYTYNNNNTYNNTSTYTYTNG